MEGLEKMRKGRLPYRRFMQEKKYPDGKLEELFYDRVMRLPEKPKLMKIRAHMLRQAKIW